MNVEILDVEVSAVNGLDYRTANTIATERAALLRKDMARNHQRSRGPARQRVGMWLVGLGLRLAGPAAAQRGSLTAPPQCAV